MTTLIAREKYVRWLLVACLFIYGTNLYAQSPADLRFPRFSYYVQIMYWHRSHPEAILPPERTCKELRQMHYNGLLLWGWKDWVAGDGWYTDAYGLDSRRFMDAAARHGLKVLLGTGFFGVRREQLKSHPEWRCIGMNGKPGQPCINEPEVLKRSLKVLERTAERYRDKPAFWGIYFDEIGWRGGYCERCARKFREWLRQHFTPEQLAHYGVRDVRAVRPVAPEHPIDPSRQKNPFLWSVSRRFANDNFAEFVARLKAHWREVAPNRLFVINNSPYCSSYFPVIYSLVRLGSLPDIQMTDLYWHASPIQGYWYEVHNSVNPHVWQIASLFRDDAPAIRRDIYLAAMHVGGIMHFDYRDLYLDLVWNEKLKRMWFDKSAKTFNPNKNPARVRAVTEALGDVEKMERYLDGAKTVSPIAILRCEYNQMNGFEPKYTPKDAEIYHLFVRNQIPVRALHVDGIAERTLSQYRVLVNTSECLADDDAVTLRKWVSRGGVLLSVGAEASLFDAYGVKRNEYALGDVFGIRRDAGFAGHVRRLPLAALKDESWQPTPRVQFVLEHEGKLVAVINRFGNGCSVLFPSGRLFSGKKLDEEAHAAPWLNFMNRAYSDNVTLSVWRRVIDWAMMFVNEHYPALIPGAPRELEVNVREQRTGRRVRRTVHLLNYGHKPIGPLSLRVLVPKSCKPARVFDAITKARIRYRLEERYVRCVLDGVNLYRAVVLEALARN